jgi:hypothetical protein
MVFRETIAVYFENHMKHINGQNAEFLNIEASGTYNNKCTKVLICAFNKFGVCGPT